MKANELRIGNLVNIINRSNEVHLQENVVFKITAIDNFRCSLVIEHDNPASVEKEFEVPLSDIAPIPLTEELLLKFGYEFWGEEKQNEFEWYKRYVLHNIIGGTSNHEVHLIISNYGNSIQEEYVTSIDKDERQYNWRMKYAHDLQNAFFKEVGSELELITPKTDKSHK